MNDDQGAKDAGETFAAAHGPLYEEVAQRLLAHAQDAEDHDATEAAVYTFMVAANQVREWASLPSLPVPSTETCPDYQNEPEGAQQ